MSATNRGAARLKNDGYQTKPETIAALLAYLKPYGSFLEPCRGSGNIYDAVAPLVATASWCELTEGIDFLEHKQPRIYDWIITNPPYSLAREFVEASLSRAWNVAMLLRLNFLGSGGRRDWWQPRIPTAIFVLAPRPSFLDRDGRPVLGKDGRPGVDACEYAWFVWSRLYSGVRVINSTEGGKR